MGGKRKHQVSEQKSNSHPKGKGKSYAKGQSDSEDGEGSLEKKSVVYVIAIVVIACACGILHRNHISSMFEGDLHFSHLSTLERELAFRTEMGLYYSYYKSIIGAPTFFDGMHTIMHDNITEYPKVINTLNRFNLYPEVVLGAVFRMFDAVTSYLNMKTKMCWQVNRGSGLTPVQSCEGIGEPSYFFIESVFALNGVCMAVFFLFGTYLSQTIFGGLLAVMAFFYNHSECTRVQWTPPLRESFGFPFLIAEMFVVTHILRVVQPSYRNSFVMAATVICFMLSWQFAQFALMTQTAAVFAAYMLGFIGSHKMKVVLLGHGIGLGISFLALFGNTMLLASFFSAALLTVLAIVLLEPVIEKIRIRVFIWLVQASLLGLGTLGTKMFIGKLLRVKDDAHIGDIFRSKFTSFRNFDTMLYTCAAEFDFMEKETLRKLTTTLLLPCIIVVVIVIIFKISRREYAEYRTEQTAPETMTTNGGATLHKDVTPEEVSIEHRSKPGAELVYHLFQLAAFTVMAVLIMRLKLFWTPHLCLLVSLLASRQLFGWLGDRTKHYAIIVAVMAAMSFQGFANLSHQMRIKGEFSDPPREELVEWINAKLPQNAVFAGPMPIMATIKLCTGRPIVNHPHYEDADLRSRVKKVYTAYSRKPIEEVWQNVVDLHVQYLIVQMNWCNDRSSRGCTMAEIWDVEDEANHGKDKTCTLLHRDPGRHFKRVFRNKHYDVLQVVPSKELNKAASPAA